MPVIVEVDPGCVIADVFVIVNVSVFVCELNSQTTVAVEKPCKSVPTILIVSAFAVAATPARTRSIASDMIDLPNRDMKNPPPCSFLWTKHIAAGFFLLRHYKWGEKLAGKTNRTIACVR